MQLITLTTDFGARDWFVGAMKGVILSINPRATVVDITHEILAGDIRGGAFTLAASYRFFPKGTIHVAVIDPGVGSNRKPVVVQTSNYFFIGPDNGVLSFALAWERIKNIRQLTNKKFFVQPVSRTFHGRDIFAPVAAHLSKGVPLQALGLAQKDFVRSRWLQPKIRARRIEGEVVYIDRFGNAITNIGNDLIPRGKAAGTIVVHSRRCPVQEFYQAVGGGAPVGVPGSSGFLEIAINGGSAARKLHLKIGDTVVVRL